MTVLATLALFRIVRIVVAVTGNAADFERDVEDRFDVTIYARNRKVRAFDHIVGVSVVIKSNRRPGLGYVANFALGAKMALMVVFFEVTRNAGDLQRVREWILAMTIITGKLCMPAVQREADARAGRQIRAVTVVGPQPACLEVPGDARATAPAL